MVFNVDGGVLVVSSNLTGQFWDGCLNYFSAEADISNKIYQTHVSKDMYVGMADAAWVDETHVVVATDEGGLSVFSLNTVCIML